MATPLSICGPPARGVYDATILTSLLTYYEMDNLSTLEIPELSPYHIYATLFPLRCLVNNLGCLQELS